MAETESREPANGGISQRPASDRTEAPMTDLSRSGAGARARARARYLADRTGSGGTRPCADADGVRAVRLLRDRRPKETAGRDRPSTSRA